VARVTTPGWALETARDDLSRTSLVEVDVPEPGDGEALLRVDRVGLTANNVTYAVLGDALHYWRFFPAATEGHGRVPLWGFAEVVASRTDGVEPGQRVYGYLPPASHLLVRPHRVGASGFRDAGPHRASLPAVYNAYAFTTADPAHEPEREDLQVLYRPLFLTSFLLADQLAGQEADVVVLSSASSRTAYGTAFLLRGGAAEVVGLTSPRNVGFTTSLGCYDRVLPYDDVPSLAAAPTAYVDLAGSTPLRRALHDHLGSDLVLDLVVGVTHQDASPAGALPGPRPEVFFAPDRVAARTADWGREGLDQRFGEAWRRFAPAVEQWTDVTVSTGPEALRDVWREVLGGSSDPRTGHVLTL
jgi:NADPH:quinone reductase-like Zn-dependent oxidoreductase